MFAVTPFPIFTFGGSGSGSDSASVYRPAVSSPLSSSPVRAASSPPALPPLSPRDPNTLPRREAQSSPTAAPPTAKFRFATGAPRPNPAVRKREDAREGRRRLFLSEVRQRADDKKWERRGGDQELLKLEWWRLNRELRQAKEDELARFGTDEEIEAATRLQEEMADGAFDGGDDDMMVDAIAQEEEAEIEALISSMPRDSNEPASSNQTMDATRNSIDFSDEDEYDSLFMDFAAQESPPQTSQQGGREPACPQDMDMS